MKCKQLVINLKSDLISGSGESFGNIIDTDTTHDKYGFPYIPSRRIKGLIREAVYELEQFDCVDEGTSKMIFGSDNEEGKHFVLHDAYLQNYEEMKNEIVKSNQKIKKYVQPVHVMNHYTVIRHQTAIENDTAKENSLRSLRAVCKGTKFVSYIEYDEAYEDVLLKAIKLVRHMGINRTRGFGEVELTIEDATQSTHTSLFFEDDVEYDVKLVLENKSQLSISGFEGEKTLDYIPGNSILGYFAGQYLKNNEADETFNDLFINGKLKFSNAYISDEYHNDYYPIKESIFKQKVYDKEAGPEYFDKTVENYKDTGTIILSKVRNSYMSLDKKYKIKNVDKEVVYHHRRPDDKSYGHVIDNSGQGTGTFYQLEVMSPDQVFVGHIYGLGKDLKKVLDKKYESIQIGKSKNTQYGNVRVVDIKQSPIKKDKIAQGTKVVCTLISPLLLLNERKESILSVKAIEDILPITIDQTFVGYQKIGGYNSKWKLQKQSYNTLAPGSCFTGVLKEDVDSLVFAGMGQAYGLGQIRVDKMKEEVVISKYEEQVNMSSTVKYTKDIVIDTLKYDLYKQALSEVHHISERSKLGNTQNGRLLLILEGGNWNHFKNEVSQISDSKKRQRVLNIVEKVEKIADKVCREHKAVKEYITQDMIQQLYKDTMKEVLLLRKYEGRKA